MSIKALEYIEEPLYHYVNHDNVIEESLGAHDLLIGDTTGLYGDCTGVSGDATGVIGFCSGVYGNLDNCEISSLERESGVELHSLVDRCRV